MKNCSFRNIEEPPVVPLTAFQIQLVNEGDAGSDLTLGAQQPVYQCTAESVLSNECYHPECDETNCPALMS